MFSKLTREEIVNLNEVAKRQITFAIEKIDVAKAKEMLGWTLVKEDEPCHYSRKGVRAWFRNGDTNRPLNIDNSLYLAQMVEYGRFVLNGEPIIIDDKGKVVSAQHRCTGCIIAGESDPTAFFYALVVRGIPHQFADTVDTGRSRSNSDVLARNSDEFFDVELIENSSGDKFGAEAPIVRKTLCKELGGTARLFTLREKGKDISGNGKFRQPELFAFLQRGGAEVQKLILAIYNHDRGVSGKASFSRFWGISQVATALLLASNREQNPGCDSLHVDWELVETVCKALADQSNESPVAVTYAKLNQFTKKGSGKTLKRQHKFASLVSTIQQLMENGKVESSPLPTDKQMRDKKYPHFGGVDIGYVAPKRGKSEESEDDETEE